MSCPSDNPMGTDGFEFVEFAAPDPSALGKLFLTLGFRRAARHRSKDVTLYRQGDMNFLVNFCRATSQAASSSACFASRSFPNSSAGTATQAAINSATSNKQFCFTTFIVL